jgi:hypothetical protein
VSQEFYSKSGAETTGAGHSNFQQIKRLLYPVNVFPVADTSAQSLYNNIVSKLEELLDVQREEIDLEKAWRKYRGSNTDQSLDSYFHSVSNYFHQFKSAD